jgi:hypothetical protein
MQKMLLGVLTALLTLSAADTKPASATYITNNDVQSILKGMPPNSVTDQQVRVVDAGKQNVGIGVVHRSAQAAQNAVEHDQVTEVYQHPGWLGNYGHGRHACESAAAAIQ